MRQILLAGLAFSAASAAARGDVVATFVPYVGNAPPYSIVLPLPVSVLTTGFPLQSLPPGSRVYGSPALNYVITGDLGSSTGERLDSGKLELSDAAQGVDVTLTFSPSPHFSSELATYGGGRFTLFFSYGDFVLSAVPEPDPLALSAVALTTAGLFHRWRTREREAARVE